MYVPHVSQCLFCRHFVAFGHGRSLSVSDSVDTGDCIVIMIKAITTVMHGDDEAAVLPCQQSLGGKKVTENLNKFGLSSVSIPGLTVARPPG